MHSAPTVTISDGGPFATLPTVTANLSGSTVPNVTLNTIGGNMTKNPIFKFTGGGCTTEPTLLNAGSSGHNPKSQLNYPAIVTSTTGVPGLGNPPIYAGSGAIGAFRSNGSVGAAPSSMHIHDVMFRETNAPNVSNNLVAIAMTAAEYADIYEDFDTKEVQFGFLHFPPTSNIRQYLVFTRYRYLQPHQLLSRDLPVRVLRRNSPRHGSRLVLCRKRQRYGADVSGLSKYSKVIVG